MNQYDSAGNYRYPINPNPNAAIPPQETPEKFSIKLSWILGIIFILAVSMVASLFLFFPGDRAEDNSSSNANRDFQLSKITECGKDIDCFIDETYECGLAN